MKDDTEEARAGSGLVPQPPEEHVVIESEDLGRLVQWIEFFQKASDRIEVLTSKDEEFGHYIGNEGLKAARAYIDMEDDKVITDWPKPEKVAFIVRVRTSPPGCLFSEHAIEQVRFFCFGGVAFGACYFTWDGDAEEGDWANTYSLSSYTAGALAWSYIAKLIIERVRKLESQVPEFEVEVSE